VNGRSGKDYPIEVRFVRLVGMYHAICKAPRFRDIKIWEEDPHLAYDLVVDTIDLYLEKEREGERREDKEMWDNFFSRVR
jgi:hypothetical protein